MWTKENVFVTGPLGAPVYEKAEEIARERKMPHLILNHEIFKGDGRTIKRIVMSFGEHELRNKEYEYTKEILDNVVVPCVISLGDGFLLDDMCREMAETGEIVIARDEPEVMFEAALKDEQCYYAFMMEEKEKAFSSYMKMLENRKSLYDRYIG